MPRGPHRCVWPRTVLIGAVWRREHERGLSAGEKRMPAKARRISCTPLFQRSRSAPAGGPAGPDAFSRKSRSWHQVPAPRRTTPHATAPSSPTLTQVRSSAPAVTRTCPRVRMSTTLTGDSQPSGDALTRTSPELRHVVRPSSVGVGRGLTAYCSHQLAEAARAQPGERTYPGRLRRRDHTSHIKIISPVTSRYGTTFSPRCRRARAGGNLWPVAA